MKATNTSAGLKDRRVVLSTLWIFAMFNYVYADILTLYFNSALEPAAWKQFQSGQVGSIHITQGFVLVGAILMETAIAMVLLARVLPYHVNRWANIIVGIIQTGEVGWSLTGPVYSNLFYFFFAAIEIACTLFIIWYAWTWPRPEAGARLGGRPSVHEQAESASLGHADA
jgi:Family of unknown function (DUF6326)